MQSPISSGVLLNELLRRVNRLSNAFHCLLDHAGRNALNPFGD
jgi:hypothetical protein